MTERVNTLEGFLEFSCGMAPPLLVEHFEPHRAWVETCLGTYKQINRDDEYEEHVEELWLTLPEIPKEFFYNDRT